MHLRSAFFFLCIIGFSSCGSEKEARATKDNYNKLPLPDSTLKKQTSNSIDSVFVKDGNKLELTMEHALWEKSLELFDMTYPDVESELLDSTSCSRATQILHQKIYLLERSGNIEEAFSLLLKIENCKIEIDLEQKKLKKRVETLKEKWNSWPMVLSPHFSVRVEGVEAYNNLPKILSELEETALILGEVLNVSLVERIPLRLFKSSPQKIEAWYDGALVVALDWIENDSLETVKMLRHELMHAYLTQLRGKRVPRWYHEGMARNFEDLKLNVVDNEVENELIIYNNVKGDFRGKGASLKKAYILANLRIDCWIKIKGIDEFINVLNNTYLDLETELPDNCIGEDILGY